MQIILAEVGSTVARAISPANFRSGNSVDWHWRALAAEPELLLLDELFVTHSPAKTKRLAMRALQLMPVD